MAENLPTPITVALNSCFFFPHSTMQSHPAFNWNVQLLHWHQGKVVFLSEMNNTVCRLDCWKEIVATHMERGLVHQVFTLEVKSGSVYIPVTQEASVMAKVHSIMAKVCIFNCAVTLHIQFVVHTFRGWLWSGMDPMD